jgi:hypothetical protein
MSFLTRFSNEGFFLGDWGFFQKVALIGSWNRGFPAIIIKIKNKINKKESSVGGLDFPSSGRVPGRY